MSKVLGVWISEDLSWERNTQEICRKAYSRMSMLTKLKYVRVNTDDLIKIYILFVRSLTEYCSVAYHSTLTVKQADNIERIQKTCLKVILAENYVSYPAALEMCGLETLFQRRENRCLNFAKKCSKPTNNKTIFSTNINTQNCENNVRKREE